MQSSMTRRLMLLFPAGFLLLIAHGGYNAFESYQFRARMNEERLRSGLEDLLRSPDTSARVHRLILPLDGSGTLDIAGAGSLPQLQSAVASMQKDRLAGQISARVLSGPGGVTLLRYTWEQPSAAAAADLLENRARLSADLFKELAASDAEIARGAERALYRFTTATDPALIFQDEAYRNSISRIEDLLKERDEEIEAAEADSLPGEESNAFQKRQQLRKTIEEDRRQLRRLKLTETELRLPILKRIRAKEKELDAVPAPEPTATGRALRAFVWMRISESLIEEHLLPANDTLVSPSASDPESPEELKASSYKASSYSGMRRWVLSAGGGSRLLARRKALEMLMGIHRGGLVGTSKELLQSAKGSIEVLQAEKVPQVSSPVAEAIAVRLWWSLSFLGADILLMTALLVGMLRLRRVMADGKSESAVDGQGPTGP